MKIPTSQLSAVMISILSGDSSEILVLRAASVHLENISHIIEKQKGKYLPLALLLRILRFLVIMMIYADHCSEQLAGLFTVLSHERFPKEKLFVLKKDVRRTPEFQHSSLSCS